MPTVDVSILITCFNKEEYLDECVSSVLDQTFKPKEIIVVHDACENPAHHSATTSIMLPKNVGVNTARDIAFSYSTGKFILFLDADDKISPDYIQKMIDIKTDIAYPDMFLWYVHGKYGGDNKLICTPPITAQNMWHHCQIPITCLMTREVYKKLGGFHQFDVYEDWDFWIRAMIAGFKFKKAQTLLWYRQIHGSRNRQLDEVKRITFYKIRDQYEVKRKKICPKITPG